MSTQSPPDRSFSLLSLAGPVYAPTLMQSMGIMAVTPVMPLVALSLGFDVPQAAAIALIGGIVGVLGPVPVSMLMTWAGERRMMVITGFMSMATDVAIMALVGHALTVGPTTFHRSLFILGILLTSLARQVWSIGRQAYMATALPFQYRARGMSTFGGMMRFGQVLGPMVGAGVIALGEDHWVFGLDAAVMLAATLMTALWMAPNEKSTERTSLRQARAPIEPRPSPHNPRYTAGQAMALASFAVVPLTIARMGRPLVVPFMGEAMGLSADKVSLVFAIAAIAEIAMFAPAGFLMDRFGRAAMLSFCLGLSGLGYLVLAAVGLIGTSPDAAFTALTACTTLLALGNGFGAGILMTLGLDLSPEHQRTRHLARWSMVNGSGNLLTPAIVSLVSLVWPVAVAGGIIGALAVGASVWAAHFIPQVTPPPRGRRKRKVSTTS